MYWTRTPKDLVDDAATVPPRVYQVWLVLADRFRANERTIPLPSQAELARACGCKSERTIRRALAKLEGLKWIRRHRDLGQVGQPWLVTLDFEFRGQLYLESPDAVRGPQSEPRRKRTPRTSVSGSPRTSKSGSPRTPKSAPLLGLDGDPKGMMVMGSPGRDDEAPAPSSSSLACDPGPGEDTPAADALGGPWRDPRGGGVESPRADAAIVAAAAQLRAKAAEAHPQMGEGLIRAKLLEATAIWLHARRRDGRDGGEGVPATKAEAIEAVGLAVDYARHQEARTGRRKEWPYVLDTVKRWANMAAWDLETCRAEVRSVAPKAKAGPAPEVERPRPAVESPELAVARAAYLRALTSVGPLRETTMAAALARVAELEAEEAARRKEAGGEVSRLTPPPARDVHTDPSDGGIIA